MSEDSIPYPWQQPVWQHFLKLYEQQRVPHAVLLAGQRGVGKLHLANTMADLLLCRQPRSSLPCGHCRGCELNRSQSHPDKATIQLEAGARQIKIDQVRALTGFVAETAQQGGNKVVVLGPLEQLNTNAANALLKNLEEPTTGTFFIVFSHMVSEVMATIRSRCQIMPVPLPTREESIQWLSPAANDSHSELSLCLDLAAGAPLLAQRLLMDGTGQITLFIQALVTLQTLQGVTAGADLSLARTWGEIELSDLLNWWLQLVYLSIANKTTTSAHPGQPGALQSQIRGLTQLDYNQQWLFRFYDKLLMIKRQVLQGANHNRQLLLEELLLDWYAIVKTAPR